MWEIIIRSVNAELIEHSLQPGKTSLGRSSDNTVPVAGDQISRSHCELDLDPNTDVVTLNDLDSRNGTFLNGRRLKEATALQAGDQIRIGASVIDFRAKENNARSGYEGAGLETRPLTKELLLESVDQHAVLLNEIALKLNTVSDLETAIAKVTDLAKKVLGADACSIILAKHFDQLKKRGYPSSITRPVIEEHLIVLMRDASTDPNLGKTAMLQGVRSALCVPVQLDNEILAILYAAKTQASSSFFTEQESELAVGISHQLALAIQRKKMETALRRNAFRDSLTGLANQVLFTDLLHQAAERRKTEPDFSFAVITLDLDSFSEINDVYGPSFGDQLIIGVGRRFEEKLRPGDSIARLTGAAFAFICNDIHDENAAIVVANRLQETLSAPFDLISSGVSLSAGIGIRLSTQTFDKPIDLRRDAETAMYRAKEMGKSQYAIFDKAMRDRSIAYYELEKELRRAMEDQEFSIKYHPIISLDKGSITGFEALARWQRPKESPIAAKDFIPLAEKTELIFSIDMLVLQVACNQMRKWQKKFPERPELFISTNLSGRQLTRPGLVDKIKESLLKSGLAATQLQLEFSERILMENREEAISVLSEIKGLGVRISIDDFGTGYSSLNYLRLFPINSLKIDRSFISGEDWETAKLVTELGQAMELEIFAEGVENSEQLERVKEMNCDYAQGMFFSEVVDAGEALSLLEKSPNW